MRIVVREDGEEKAHAHCRELRYLGRLGFLLELGGFLLQLIHVGESLLIGGSVLEGFQTLLSFSQLLSAFPRLFLHITAPFIIGQRLCPRQLELDEIMVCLEEQ